MTVLANGEMLSMVQYEELEGLVFYGSVSQQVRPLDIDFNPLDFAYFILLVDGLLGSKECLNY